MLTLENGKSCTHLTIDNIVFIVHLAQDLTAYAHKLALVFVVHKVVAPYGISPLITHA